MLSIVNSDGIDLVAVPPTAQALKAQTDAGLDYAIQLRIIEDSLSLPSRCAAGTIYWNDGQVPEVFPYGLSSNGTLTVDTHRILVPGMHVIRVTAHNYRAPNPDTAGTNFSVTVLARSQIAVPVKNLIAPILPKDTGYPNAQQWNFDVGYDTAVLQSSVKMLLNTNLGERIMMPDYGTRLKTILFEPMGEGMEDLIQQEIAGALNRWEPRVNLQSLNVERVSARSIVVSCEFAAKATQDLFATRSTFEI
jgi:hypothetical protein